MKSPRILPPAVPIPAKRRKEIRQTVDAVVSKRRFEEMVEDEGGWTDWIHPLPGYLMQCCDCGLIHEMQFAIGKTRDKGGPFNLGESDRKGVVLFRAHRKGGGTMTKASEIEAVARAIYECQFIDGWPGDNGIAAELCRQSAHAAIEALSAMEPTEAMIEAGRRAVEIDYKKGYIQDCDIIAIFRAMNAAREPAT